MKLLERVLHLGDKKVVCPSCYGWFWSRTSPRHRGVGVNLYGVPTLKGMFGFTLCCPKCEDTQHAKREWDKPFNERTPSKADIYLKELEESGELKRRKKELIAIGMREESQGWEQEGVYPLGNSSV